MFIAENYLCQNCCCPLHTRALANTAEVVAVRCLNRGCTLHGKVMHVTLAKVPAERMIAREQIEDTQANG